MKAAILEKLNSPLVVDDVEFLNLDVGQVLVEVHCSGICGAQIGEISGAKGPDPYLPHLLGHEGAGVVLAIGPGVTHVHEGDHVVMHWRPGQGIDSSFPKYKWKDGLVGGGKATTFNEQAVVSENRLTVIDKSVSFDVASLFGCAVTTALGLINNEAQLKIGQSIAVAGCGGVGLNIVQGAFMVSANPIIAVDVVSHKLFMARELGATHVINSALDDFVQLIYNTVGKRGLDVFVDCTGSVEVIAEGYNVVASGGRMILVGQPGNGKHLTIKSLRHHYRGKMIIDSQGGLTDPNVDIPRYLGLYQTGKLRLSELITHRFPLAQVNDALEVVRFGKAGRCLLEMR